MAEVTSPVETVPSSPQIEVTQSENDDDVDDNDQQQQQQQQQKGSNGDVPKVTFDETVQIAIQVDQSEPGDTDAETDEVTSNEPTTPGALSVDSIELKDKSQRRLSVKLDQLDTEVVQAALRKHDELQKEPTLDEVMSRKKTVSDAVKFILRNERDGPTKLDLSKKGISNSGVYEIAEALKLNDTIREIDLSDNIFDDEAAIYLADMLKRNMTLMSLFLDNNFIRDRGTSALVETLERNRTLTELTLNPMFSSEDDLDMIDMYLDRNYDALAAKLREQKKKEMAEEEPEQKKQQPSKAPAVHRRIVTYIDELELDSEYDSGY